MTIKVVLFQDAINPNFRVLQNREYNSYTALHLAVVREHPFVAELLVEEPSVELSLIEDYSRMTPLHMAVNQFTMCSNEQLNSILRPEILFNLQQIEEGDFVSFLDINMKHVFK